MGTTVVDSRDRNRELVDSLHSWMDRRRQDRQISDQQADADRRTRINVAQAQLQQIHPSQRGAFIARLPEDVRGFFSDSASLPAPQYSPAEQAEQLYGEHKLKSAQSYQPTPFDQSYMNMEGILGRNPNATWSEAERDRSFMTPEVFKTYADEGFVAPSEAEKNRAAAGKDVAETEFTKGPKTSTEYAQGGKYRAETGKIGAETTKVIEETTTERQLRDPNSGATQAKATAGGRKTAAQQKVEDYDDRLRKLDQARATIVTEIEGEKAARSGQGASPYLRKKEAELRATDVLIKDAMEKRNRLVNGAAKNGVTFEKPAAPDPLGIR